MSGCVIAWWSYSFVCALHISLKIFNNLSMIFAYFKTKIPNFLGNSEHHKTGKHSAHVTYILLTQLATIIMSLGVSKKIREVFLLDLLKSIPVNNVYVIIYIYQSYIYFKIQWFHEWLIQNSMICPWILHFGKFQDLFMKFKDFSMILKEIWISMIFQELWDPCLCNIWGCVFLAYPFLLWRVREYVYFLLLSQSNRKYESLYPLLRVGSWNYGTRYVLLYVLVIWL